MINKNTQTMNNLQFYFTDFTSIYSFVFVHFFWSYTEYGHLTAPTYKHATDDYKSKLIAPKWVYPILWCFSYICICLSIFFVQYFWNHMEEYVFQTIWIVFIVHTFLSKFWSFVFFYVQAYTISLFFSVALWVLSAVYFSFCFIIHGSVFPYVTSFLALPMLVLETYLVLVCFVIMYNGTEVSNEDIKIALNETERKIDKLPTVIQSSIVSALQGMVSANVSTSDSESHGAGAKPTYSPNAPVVQPSRKSAYFGNGNKNK